MLYTSDEGMRQQLKEEVNRIYFSNQRSNEKGKQSNLRASLGGGPLSSRKYTKLNDNVKRSVTPNMDPFRSIARSSMVSRRDVYTDNDK